MSLNNKKNRNFGLLVTAAVFSFTTLVSSHTILREFYKHHTHLKRLFI